MTEPKKKFHRNVDRRSRRAMAEFLAGHFRYNTMNSWNDSTTYANKVKIYDVIPNDLQNKAFEVLEAQDSESQISYLLADFDREHDYRWQVGFNGRSSGYIVLYQGGWRPSQHKRICTTCGQKNFQAETTKCGRCHAETMIDYKGRDVYTQPGIGTDHGCDLDTFMDPDEWSMSDLRERVELVQEFDQLCDDVVAEFISLCEDYEVVEETVMVPHTVKVLR
jgi:ribosomal protein S27AE